MERPVGTGRAADVTGLLRAWSAGDAAALDQLSPILHADLKRIAKRHMDTRAQGTHLQPLNWQAELKK